MKLVRSHEYGRKIAFFVLSAMMLAVAPAFSQSKDKTDDALFENYEKRLYSISTSQIRYPEMTFDYVYDNQGKLQAVTIRGIDNPKDREALRMWLTDLQTLSNELLYKKDDNGVYYKAEENARPLQGKRALYRELKNNIEYPKKAKRLGVEGVVNLKFTVDRYGDIDNLQASADFDAPEEVKKELMFEAKRAFKNCEQNWEPAEINNFAVAEWIILPVNFQLELVDPLPRLM